MGYDEVLPYLGNFGRYQKWIYFLMCLPGIACAFQTFVSVILMATPEFRCRLPEESANASFKLPESVWNDRYPIDDLTGKFSKCSYYNEVILNSTESTVREQIKCDSWIYDNSLYANSVVTEWNLVCDRSFLKAVADSFYMFGVLLGAIFFGGLSDRFGRKPAYILSIALQFAVGILTSVATDFFFYTFARVLVGAANSGVFLVAYVIALEMVGKNYRLFVGTGIMIFFSCGYLLITVFAYFIRDWRTLQLSLSVPGVIFLGYWWLIPESPRWLLTKNRYQEAIDIIKHQAKWNRAHIPTDVYEKLKETNVERKSEKDFEKKSTILDVFRYPNLRRKSLLIFFIWFVNNSTYYGLSWNTNNLGDHYLLNFAVSAAVEIPAYVITLSTLNRFGRKRILAGCLTFAGTVLTLTMLIPSNKETLLVVLAMLGKMAITASFNTIYLFSSEQFPTVIRNVGLGVSSMCARIGGILSPYVLLLSSYWKPFPMIIFGIMALIAGILTAFLPETLNKKLPETIEDGECFGKKIRVENVEGNASAEEQR